MSANAFHPDAFAGLDEIWEYIAQDKVDAADRILADIHSTRPRDSEPLAHRAAARPASPPTPASWNQVAGWLKPIDGLRQAA